MKFYEKDCFLPNNFLGLPSDCSNFDESKVVIFPVPFEHTTSYQPGTKNGPSAIIKASQNVELYDSEIGEEIYPIGICTLPELIPDLSAHEKNVDLIEKNISEILKKKKFPITLGGEHSISEGIVKAFAKKHKKFSVLQLDAHADLRSSYQNTPYSHACAMRRILEYAPAVQVGIRNLCKEEAEFAAENGLPIFYADRIHDNDDWMEEAIAGLEKKVYVTIDLDVFDPSIMPAVGTPEPGGLGWYQVLRFLRKVAQEREVLGFDVVELAPLAGQFSSDFIAAKLIYKFLGYIFR